MPGGVGAGGEKTPGYPIRLRIAGLAKHNK